MMTPDPFPTCGLWLVSEPYRNPMILLGPLLNVTFLTCTTAFTVFSAAVVKSTSLIPDPLKDVGVVLVVKRGIVLSSETRAYSGWSKNRM
jgi:hypothetical protein